MDNMMKAIEEYISCEMRDEHPLVWAMSFTELVPVLGPGWEVYNHMTGRYVYVFYAELGEPLDPKIEHLICDAIRVGHDVRIVSTVAQFVAVVAEVEDAT